MIFNIVVYKGLKNGYLKVNKDMNKYQNGKIYQVVDVGFNKCYIGSTTEELSRRMARHRERYKGYCKGGGRQYERSMMLFDEYGLDNCKILLIKDFPCKSRAELEREEGTEILNKIDMCVNKNVVGRSRKEFYHDNRERLLQEKKEHRINNIDRYKEKDKRYTEHNKEQIRERHSRWYQQNKDEVNEKNRARYQHNREKYLAQQKQPFHCDCGASCVWNVKARHFKSQKHQQWLKQQEPEQEPQVEQEN